MSDEITNQLVDLEENLFENYNLSNMREFTQKRNFSRHLGRKQRGDNQHTTGKINNAQLAHNGNSAVLIKCKNLLPI